MVSEGFSSRRPLRLKVPELEVYGSEPNESHLLFICGLELHES